MKDDFPCRVAGPAVAAFDAEMEAVESGVLFTPEQWSFAKQNIPARLPALPSRIGRGSDPLGLPTVSPTPRVRGSISLSRTLMSVTQPIPVDTLETLVEQCRMS